MTGVLTEDVAEHWDRAAVLGSPFDYLSSRLDENDAIFVLDNAFVPWEDVFVYGDVEKATTFSLALVSCRELLFMAAPARSEA